MNRIDMAYITSYSSPCHGIFVTCDGIVICANERNFKILLFTADLPQDWYISKPTKQGKTHLIIKTGSKESKEVGW